MMVSAAAKINGDMANEKRTSCLLKTAGPYYGFNKKIKNLLEIIFLATEDVFSAQVFVRSV